MRSLGRGLDVAAWLAPALVFAVAGALKLVDPGGTAPRALGVTEGTWQTALRALGALESAIALLVLLPRTRRAGLLGMLLLLAVFGTGAAALAGDGAFLADCGCFGAVTARPASAEAALTTILLRNAVLGGLAASALFRARARWARGAVVAALLFALPFAAGQRALRVAAAARLAALEQGQDRAATLGWELTDFPLRAPDGDVRRAGDVVRPLDVLVLASPGCAACADHARAWPAYADRLRAVERRLVILGIGPLADVRAFLRSHGSEEVAHYAVEDPLAVLRLGVHDVPRTLVLDAGRRVVATDLLAPPAPVAAALLREGGSGEALAKKLLGAEIASVTADPTHARSYLAERDGEPLRLLIAESTQPSAEHLLLAIALDRSGQIVALDVLAASAFLEAVDPGLQRPALLRGLSVTRARGSARALARAMPFEAPLWRGVERALGEWERGDSR